MIKQCFDCKKCARWNENTHSCPPISCGFRVFETKGEKLSCKYYCKQQSLFDLTPKGEKNERNEYRNI